MADFTNSMNVDSVYNSRELSDDQDGNIWFQAFIMPINSRLASFNDRQIAFALIPRTTHGYDHCSLP